MKVSTVSIHQIYMIDIDLCDDIISIFTQCWFIVYWQQNIK